MFSELGIDVISDFSPVPAAETSELVAADDETIHIKFSFAAAATTTFMSEVIIDCETNKARIDIIIKYFFKLSYLREKFYNIYDDDINNDCTYRNHEKLKQIILFYAQLLSII